MAANNYIGNTLLAIKIIKVNDTVEISNQSLRLDAQRKPISYELKWIIDHIRHSQTVPLKAGEKYVIKKLDWRELDKHERITNNLKLSIQAQDIFKEFRLGHSKNISEIESISFQKIGEEITISAEINDMDSNMLTESHNFSVSPDQISELERKINHQFSNLPRFSNDFTSHERKKIEFGINKENTYSISANFSTNYEYLNGIGKSGPVHIKVEPLFECLIKQEDLELNARGGKYCFSVKNCKENGEIIEESVEINLTLSDEDELRNAVSDFNKTNDFFLYKKPSTKFIESIREYQEIKVENAGILERFALQVDFNKAPKLPVSGYRPHLTVHTAKPQAVEIINVEFRYTNESIFPTSLAFKWKKESPFSNASPIEQILGIGTDKSPISNLVSFIENPLSWKFRSWLGKKSETHWVEKEQFISKSTFENAPYIPFTKLDDIIEVYTGKKTGRTYFYDVFDGIIGYLDEDEYFNPIEKIQMWMVKKEEVQDLEMCFLEYFPPDHEWHYSEGIV